MFNSEKFTKMSRFGSPHKNLSHFYCVISCMCGIYRVSRLYKLVHDRWASTDDHTVPWGSLQTEKGWAPSQPGARHAHVALEEARHSFQEANFTFYFLLKKKAVKKSNILLTGKSQSTVRKTMKKCRFLSPKIKSRLLKWDVQQTSVVDLVWFGLAK